MPPLPDVLRETIADEVIMWLVFFGSVYGFVRKKIVPHMIELQQFFQDFYGVPNRVGVPGRQGVMERLANQDAVLQTIVSNVTPNGGGSAYDKLIQGQEDIAARVARVREDVEDLTRRFNEFKLDTTEDRTMLHEEQEELRGLVAFDPCKACPMKSAIIEGETHEHKS